MNNKKRYIYFKCGKWVVLIKNRAISRHVRLEDAINARNKFIKQYKNNDLRFDVDTGETDE